MSADSEAPRLLVSRNRDVRHRMTDAIRRALAGEPAPLRVLAGATSASSPFAARVAAGVAAAEAYRREAPATAGTLETALLQAAVLFRAGLFFEAHEVLEDAWRGLTGSERTFVQGLLQIAVGMHHLAHGKATGAATLFERGRAKLADRAPVVAGVEVESLLAGLAAWQAAATAGRWPTATVFPPFRVRSARARRPSR